MQKGSWSLPYSWALAACAIAAVEDKIHCAKKSKQFTAFVTTDVV